MKRLKTEINTGSMADIAFLLLIFFLVATTIDMDSGIERKLPPYDPNAKPPVVKERNILNVKVNSRNEIMINRKVCNVNEIRHLTQDFLMNPHNDPKKSDRDIIPIDYLGEIGVTKGIISLQNDNGTSYNMYVKVLNELIATGNKIKNDLSQERFGKNYELLSPKYQKAINMARPCIISEAEPVRIGSSI